MAALERLTRGHRYDRAARLERRGHELERRAARASRFPVGSCTMRGETVPVLAPVVDGRASRWHRARAKGQRDRFRRLERCGQEWGIVQRCRGCGAVEESHAGCGIKLLCRDCGRRLQAKAQDTFRRSRMGLRVAADRAGVTRRKRPRSAGGRFGERFVTLTIPHTARLGVQERIDLLSHALKYFSDAFRRWICSEQYGPHKRPDLRTVRLPTGQRLSEFCHWERAIEWTPGDDRRGHPHAHIWMFGPYVPRSELEAMWRESMRRAGYEYGEEQACIVDVRACGADGEYVDRETGERRDVVRELCKYMTKTTADTRVHPSVFADVYIALERVRIRQTSAGFRKWSLIRIHPCECCAAVDYWETRLEPMDAGLAPCLVARGPPVARPTLPALPRDPPDPYPPRPYVGGNMAARVALRVRLAALLYRNTG